MKLSTVSYFLAATAAIGSLIPVVTADSTEPLVDITFKSENLIEDTPETLAILEAAIVHAAAASHDSESWHLDSDQVVESKHERVGKKEEGSGRRLGKYGNDDDAYEYYLSFYRSAFWITCWTCRRNLATVESVQDDADSHAKWEAALCEILSQTDAYAGVSDCVITFVEPPAAEVAKEKVELYTDIKFKTESQVYDSQAVLEAIETALTRSSDASHDPDNFMIETGGIVSTAHSREHSGGRRLGKYGNDDDAYEYYLSFYRSAFWITCWTCRRNLSEGKHLDDDESHAKWEKLLCKLLNRIDGLEDVSDCTITFVEED